MSYNVFKPTPQKKGGVTVSFKKWGISFSRKTSATYFSDSPHAELYFDEEKQKVAIKPLKEKTENSYDVKGDKSKHIKAKDFYIQTLSIKNLHPDLYVQANSRLAFIAND